MVHAFRVPSGRRRGTRNMASPAVPGRGALGPGEGEGHVGIGIRAEPLVAPEAPRAVGVPPRHASSAAPTSDPPVRSVIHCVPCQSSAMSVAVRPGQIGAPGARRSRTQRSIREVESVTVDRAEQAELRLREEIRQRVLHGVRHAARPAEHALAMRHGGEAEAAEGEALHLRGRRGGRRSRRRAGPARVAGARAPGGFRSAAAARASSSPPAQAPMASRWGRARSSTSGGITVEQTKSRFGSSRWKSSPFVGHGIGCGRRGRLLPFP